MRDEQMYGMEIDGLIPKPRLKMLLDQELAKRLRYQQEMVRRRHNYLPFIVVLLQILAEEKKLLPMYEKAKERASKKGPKKMKI